MTSSPDASSHVELAELDELELEIEKLVAGGDGLGRHQRLPIFVPRSAPGDKLRIRISQRRPQFARGEILEILEPGPARREPPCPHFADCGGCSLQHLEDRSQVEWKVRAAREALDRLSGLQIEVPERVVSGDPWHYRLRTQLQLDGEPGAARVGYFGRGSHELVQIQECPVLVEPLETFVKRLPRELTGRVPRRLDVASGDGGSLSCGPAVPGLPKGAVARRVGDFVYEFDARTFFQAHAGLLEELVEAVVGTARGDVAYDLYSGVGLFSLPLARHYGQVRAVETDRIALRYLRRNAQHAGLSNVDAVGSAVESWLAELPAPAERVVVDPPRAGLSLRVRGAIRQLRPECLTYISCHPAALARDLGSLARDFSLESLTYLDLFPQTGHLEIVAQLRALGKGDSRGEAVS